MRRIALECVAALCLVGTLRAQTPGPRFELRPFVGAYLPTGPQTDAFGGAFALGAQAAVELTPSIAVVGSATWIDGHDRLSATDPSVATYQYDLGVEAAIVRPVTEVWTLKPFVGIGAGGRTYDYTDRAFGTRSFAAAYGALGSEFQAGRIAFRLEIRDFLSEYESPTTARNAMRNDMTFALGVAWHL